MELTALGFKVDAMENPEFPQFLGNPWFFGMFSSVVDEIPALLYSQLCFLIYGIRTAFAMPISQIQTTGKHKCRSACKPQGPQARGGAPII